MVALRRQSSNWLPRATSPPETAQKPAPESTSTTDRSVVGHSARRRAPPQDHAVGSINQNGPEGHDGGGGGGLSEQRTWRKNSQFPRCHFRRRVLRSRFLLVLLACWLVEGGLYSPSVGELRCILGINLMVNCEHVFGRFVSYPRAAG